MKTIYKLLILILFVNCKTNKQFITEAKLYSEIPGLPHINSTKVVTFKLNFNKPILIDEDSIETNSGQKFHIQSIFNTIW